MGKQWVARQHRDGFVRAARQHNFRARSAFKLAEIDRKYKLLRADSRVVDLGAAPGSWSQYASSVVQTAAQIIAVDISPMQPVAKVRFIRGDCTEAAVLETVVAAFDGRLADLVLSDMSPNISGVRSTDQARAEILQRAVLDFCQRGLRGGGAMLSKVFAGESQPNARAMFAAHFANLREVKPAASRSESREMYILARGFRAPPPAKNATIAPPIK